VDGLRLAPEHRWLRLLYRCRCKKYNQGPDMQRQLAELEAPAAPPEAGAAAGGAAAGPLQPAAARQHAAGAQPPAPQRRGGTAGEQQQQQAARKGAGAAAATPARTTRRATGAAPPSRQHAPGGADGPSGSGRDAAARSGGCGLGANTGVLACRAEWLHHQGRYEECYSLTEAVLERDPYATECLVPHLTSALQLGRKNELFLRCAAAARPAAPAAPRARARAAQGSSPCCRPCNPPPPPLQEPPARRGVPRLGALLVCHRLLLPRGAPLRGRAPLLQQGDGAGPQQRGGVGRLWPRVRAAGGRWLAAPAERPGGVGNPHTCRGAGPALVHPTPPSPPPLRPQDESDQALAAYRTAARLFPGLHVPMLGMGIEYSRMNNLGLAERLFHSAHALCPEDPLVCHEIGVLEYRNARYEPAERWLRTALARFTAAGGGAAPAGAEPTLLALGHARRKLRDFAGALEAYRGALALAPHAASTHAAVGFALQLRGDCAGAVREYHVALGLRPDDTFTQEMLGEALREECARASAQMAEEDDDGGGGGDPMVVR
jgi:tetratricopeptide (TPR) repeat protein